MEWFVGLVSGLLRVAAFGIVLGVAHGHAQSESSPSTGDQLLPNVQPDVIYVCKRDGQIVPECNFGCANYFGVVNQTSPSGVGSDFASRVELYLKSIAGRTDQHIWVAMRHKANASSRTESVTLALVALNFTCTWPDKRGDRGGPAWVVEKFAQ